MSGPSPDQFFEEWLPEQFEQLRKHTDTSTLADCSLLAEVDTSSWRVAVQGGELRVDAKPINGSPTFRIRTDDASFRRLATHLLESSDAGAAAATELRLLRLDEETCRLVGNVAEAIRFVVMDDEVRSEMIFAPGGVDPERVGCTISCQLADLREVRAGSTNAMELFMTGRLTLDGNVEVAMALGGIFL